MTDDDQQLETQVQYKTVSKMAKKKHNADIQIAHKNIMSRTLVLTIDGRWSRRCSTVAAMSISLAPEIKESYILPCPHWLDQSAE